jgi:hypothetical protein
MMKTANCTTAEGFAMRIFVAIGESPVLEGLRLSLWNLGYIVLSAGVFVGAIISPFPLPFSSLVILLLPMIAVGYFWVWFRFFSEYGKLVSRRLIWKSLIVGAIGVWPNLSFLWLVRYYSSIASDSCGVIVWALAYVIFIASAVVMPLWGLIALSLSPERNAAL